MSAFEQISSLKSLRFAWDQINAGATGKRRKSSGIDNESIEDFAANADANLRVLQERVRRSRGDYEFADLKGHLIPKPNGSLRVISVPTVRDRIVQRSVLKHLSDTDHCGLANEVSYGFVKTRSVSHAVGQAKALRRSKPYAYKSDISKYFDEIDRGVLEGRIRTQVKFKSLRRLLINMSHCEIASSTTSRNRAIKKCGIRTGRGIRQGMPVSPFFANLFLSGFDAAAIAQQLKMVRYADDFIVFTKDEASCLAAHEFCKRELSFLDLSIPELGASEKTRVFQPDEDAEFLGVGIVRNSGSYAVRVLPKQFDSIRSRFLEYRDIRKLIAEGVSLAGLTKRLEGVAAGYVGAYRFCDNVADLEVALDDWREKLITGVLSDLGLDVSVLTPERRAFCLG